MISEQKKNKKLFFLMGMPRSGNTLFASLMNQNPKLVVTANSITLEIMKDIWVKYEFIGNDLSFDSSKIIKDNLDLEKIKKIKSL